MPLLLLLFAAAPQIVAAEGAWATVRQGTVCEAVTAGLRAPTKDRPQARLSLAFDARPGARHGELAVRLGRAPRPGASVMLTVGDRPFLLVARGDWAWSRGPAQQRAIIVAMRGSAGARVEARAPSGARIVERFDLTGAPTAIDAAAVCALNLLQKA